MTIINTIIQLITNRTTNGYTANTGKLSKLEILYVINNKKISNIH